MDDYFTLGIEKIFHRFLCSDLADDICHADNHHQYARKNENCVFKQFGNDGNDYTRRDKKNGNNDFKPSRMLFQAKKINALLKADYTGNGYAASATGTPEFNKELSLKRAQAVVDVLVKDYGIPANRLKISADGGVDKFGQPILNRVVLVKSAN